MTLPDPDATVPVRPAMVAFLNNRGFTETR